MRWSTCHPPAHPPTLPSAPDLHNSSAQRTNASLRTHSMRSLSLHYIMLHFGMRRFVNGTREFSHLHSMQFAIYSESARRRNGEVTHRLRTLRTARNISGEPPSSPRPRSDRSTPVRDQRGWLSDLWICRGASLWCGEGAKRERETPPPPTAKLKRPLCAFGIFTSGCSATKKNAAGTMEGI